MDKINEILNVIAQHYIIPPKPLTLRVYTPDDGALMAMAGREPERIISPA